jgi:hypothetical protein
VLQPEKAMKAHPFRTARAIARMALLALSSTALFAHAQSQQSAQASPMVKSPPEAASGAASATNPDNMPVKKPQQPTNDRIIRNEPASAAKAK